MTEFYKDGNKFCHNCDHWRSPSFFLPHDEVFRALQTSNWGIDVVQRRTYYVAANCKLLAKGYQGSCSDGMQQVCYLRHDAGCDLHAPRQDEPLGVGQSKIWFFTDKPKEHPFFLPAVQHDLEYERLKPGESTARIDKNLLNNCLAMCNNRQQKALAYLFYGLARLYSFTR